MSAGVFRRPYWARHYLRRPVLPTQDPARNLGTPTGVSSTPSVGTPTLTQVHQLDPNDVAVAPSVGTPAVSVIHTLTATGVSSAASVGAPTLTQVHRPTATGVTVQPDVAVSVTNLLTHSEQLNDASWTAHRLTVTPDALLAPNGAVSAEKLVEVDASSGTHRVYKTIAKAASALTYTASAFFYAGERTFAQIRAAENGEANASGVAINLATGELGATYGAFTNKSATASAVPGYPGWWRLTFTFTTLTATSLTIYLLPALSLAAAAPSYVGVANQGIYAWGAMLNAGEVAPYVATTTAAATRTGVVLTQVHALTATGAASSPSVASPALTQVHALTATGLLSSSVLSSPTLTQTHFLTATGLLVAVSVGAPSASEYFEPWPAILPAYVEESGYTETLPDTRIDIQTDFGPGKSRKRFTTNWRVIQCAIRCTDEQAAAFDDFYVTTLRGGVAQFEWVNPITQAPARYRFGLPEPRITYIDADHYLIQMTLRQVA